MVARQEGEVDVVLVWLERAVDGTAAGQHLRGTQARFAEVGSVGKVLIVADRTTGDGRERLVSKLARLLSLALRAASLARPGRLMFGRHHPLMLPIVLLWRLVGGRVILSVQGSLDAPSNEYPLLGASKLLRMVSRASTKIANGVVVGAPPLEAQVRSEMLRSTTPVCVLPNGVFVDEMRTAGRSARPMDQRYVIFVGNLARWQGVDVMVEAIDHPNWPKGIPLVVVGDGVETERVRAHPGVIYLGRQPAIEAARWYAHAECSLSLQRGGSAVGAQGYWPFKMIESAAVGVPVVCSDAKGLPEAAQSLGNAIVVPDGDGAACARAVAQICTHSTLQSDLGSMGRANAPLYDWAAGGAVLAKLINTVVYAESDRRD